MDGNGNNLLSTQEFSRIQEGLDFDELLKELREEICMDNELSTINFHDEFLLRFLYSRQLDIKKTRQSIKAYLVAKKNEPEIFQLPYQITQAFNCNFIGILPDKNPINGETILITRPGSWNPDKFSFEVLTAATAVTLEVASFDFDTQVHGIIDIIDMTGFGWKQLKHYGPFQAQKTAEVTEKLMPARFNEIHIINESYLARMAYTLVKNFLSDDFTNKIHFHGSDLSKLHKVVSPEILPMEIGGKKESFSSKLWFDKLLQSEAALQALWNKYSI